MRLAQLNTVVGTGSTGRIVDAIDRSARARGHDVLTGYGRGASDRASHFRIGNEIDLGRHAVKSYLLDGHGLASSSATGKCVDRISQWRPDAIALHNIHGYFLHYPTLFDFLKKAQVPIVWTLHDCWPFTGHCSYFDRYDCVKWQSQCFECPMTRYYPSSLIDRSRQNFESKKQCFTGVANLTIVAPSEWLERLVRQSFLAGYPVRTIHNGVDLSRFKPTNATSVETIVLGVASVWSARKGLLDFTRLRTVLPASYQIVLIGVTRAQKNSLPKGVVGIEKTDAVAELVSWYGKSAVFVNPTYSDNFPTTNIEALACGTPVVTYQTGGSPESVNSKTGRVVPPGDIGQLAAAIIDLAKQDRAALRSECRARAKALFDQESRYADYLDLVENLVNHSSNEQG